MLRSPHLRMNAVSSLHYSSSPASTCSDEDSEHSQPNDLSKHSGYGGHSGYPGYHHSPHHSQQSPYVATNECRVIEYRGARIAAFLSANKNPCEYLLCLPQAFELFLKHLVGGLHTVYTKLKRLDIIPIVCNVEQVRILRGLGAIQPGVNRCKLLSTKDFDVLFKDCTTASRPGRPPKRSPVAEMDSPGASKPLTYLGFPPASKKPRIADDVEQPPFLLPGPSNGSAFNGMPTTRDHSTRESSNLTRDLFGGRDAPGREGSERERSSSSEHPFNGMPGMAPSDAASLGDFSKTAAYLWFLSQQQHSAAAAAALSNMTGRLAGQGHERPSSMSHPSQAALNGFNNGIIDKLSPDKVRNSLGERSGSRDNASSGPKEERHSVTSQRDGQHEQREQHRSLGQNHSNNNMSSKHDMDDSTDDEEDDIESHNSSRSPDPITNTPFNGMPRESGSSSTGLGHHHHSHHNQQQQHSSHHHRSSPSGERTITGVPVSSSPRNTPPTPAIREVASASTSSANGSEQHCLETLLRNIEGLLAIAAHNARQQQSQLHLQKELRAELASQIERERELRDQAEKQLNEEQKIRLLFQKRYKKERRFRRKLEQELHLNQNINNNNLNQQQQGKENVDKEPSGHHTSSSPSIVDSRKQDTHSTQPPIGQNSVSTINSVDKTLSPEPASPATEEVD